MDQTAETVRIAAEVIEHPRKPSPAKVVLHEPTDPTPELLRQILQACEARPAPEPALFATVVAAFAALGYALSARALLLVALLGTFILALRVQSPMGLGVLGVWAAFTVIPTVVLEIRKR